MSSTAPTGPVRSAGPGAVRKAVIPAAGLGTRFLPATKAVPKEMLAVVDKPAIQYVVEEAAAAGITDVLIITARGKGALEDHFDRAPELEAALAAAGKHAALEQVRAVADLVRIHSVRQGEPLGLGHAVSVARAYVGDEAFAVLLPDDLMVDGGAVLRGMLAVHQERGGSVIALQDVGADEISAYGAADVAEALDGGLVRLAGVVEKPLAGEEPSTLAATGRYVFTPAIFDALDRVTPGRLGEIQLTDGIDLLLESEDVFGYLFSEGRHDVGKPMELLRANVELALERDDLRADVAAFLEDVMARKGLR